LAALQLLPAVLSLLVLAAHFLRSGNLLMVIVLLTIVGLLGVRRPWAAYTAQAALAVGVIEWIRTLVTLAAERAKAGEPGERMVLILGSVALGTGLSILVFGTARLRRRYGLGAAPGPDAV
jgi:uncharacterized membrane protein